MNQVSAFIRDVMICVTCAAIIVTLYNGSFKVSVDPVEISNPVEMHIVKGKL